MMKNIPLCRLWYLFLLICLTHNVQAGLFGPKCKQANTGPEPAWVKAGFSYQKSSYVIGFGHAVFQKKQGYDEQLLKAENLARSDLSKGLQVQVQSDLQVTTEEHSVNNKVNFKQDVVQRISTSSELDLPGLAIAQKWQNPKSCDLYVLVEVKQSIADLVAKKAIALSYFEQSKDTHFAIRTRLLVLDNAIEIAQQYDFGQLPNSETSAHLLEEMQAHKRYMLNQLTTKRNAVYFVGQPSPFMRKQLFEQLSSHIKGSFNEGQCVSSTQCMRDALATNASYTSIFSIEFSTVKERGFYIGQFQVRLSIWDINQNQLLYKTRANDFIATKVMARQDYKVNSEAGFSKWQRANPQAFSALKPYYP